MSFSGAEQESVGAHSVPRLRLTDEQPGLCAELRGPGSLSREEKEAEEEETVGGFMGALAEDGRSRGRRERRRRSGGYGFVVLKWWQPPRLKVMCQVSVRCFRHSRWTSCVSLPSNLLSLPAAHPLYCFCVLTLLFPVHTESVQIQECLLPLI